MTNVPFSRALRAGEVADGTMRAIDLRGRSILICHVKNEWYALDNICTHAYAKLNEGRLRGTRILCPLHGGAFDCRSGAVLGAPAMGALQTYETRLVDNEIEVAVPP